MAAHKRRVTINAWVNRVLWQAVDVRQSSPPQAVPERLARCAVEDLRVPVVAYVAGRPGPVRHLSIGEFLSLLRKENKRGDDHG